MRTAEVKKKRTVAAKKTPSRTEAKLPVVSTQFGRYEMLPTPQLSTDGTYQRPLSHWRVRDIVFNFKSILFQPLIIGLRSGVYYVIDGQHRKEAAVQLGFPKVPCMVYDTKSVAEEAQAFLWLQQYRRAIKPTQKFVARIAFGDQAAVAISTLMTQYKFEIDKYEGFGLSGKTNNVILPIAALEHAYDVGGVKMVDAILYVLRNAWDGRAIAINRRMIRGLVVFMRDNAYGKIALANKLKDIAPYDVDSAARLISHNRGLNEVEATAAVIANAYNDQALRARPKKSNE